MSEQTKKKSLILLDAHAIIHRAYHALPDFVSSKGEPTGALYGLVAMVLKIVKDLKPDYVIACYDLPKPTYRHIAFSGYKAKRPKAEDDLVMQLKRSRDIFSAFKVPVLEAEGFEADDLLGTIVEKFKSRLDVNITIASGDTDTLQLVKDPQTKVYTLKKGINDTVLYDEEAVKNRYGFGPEYLPDFKGLSGDPSDNIPGVKGIGEKTATMLIQKFGTVENIFSTIKKNPDMLIKTGFKPRVLELLKKSEEDAVFSKMLGTIRRDAPVDFEIPEIPWRGNVRQEDIENIFLELGFRSLVPRANELFFKKEGNSDTDAKNGLLDKGVQAGKDDISDAALALWAVDSNITDPDIDDIKNFAGTNDFNKAKQVIYSELKKRNVERVYLEIEKPLRPVILKMNARGIKIDAKYLSELSVGYHKELTAIESKIYKCADRKFNINSPKQLAEVLFKDLGLLVKNQKKTSKGAVSTRESELEKMRDAHPVIKYILEYRELQKLLTTYIDNIPSMLDLQGRLHTTFIQSGTSTGRMSSRDPNLQNIPIRSKKGEKIRDAFIAEKSWEIVSFDYSQMELRIAAFLSGDRRLMEIFKSGKDVHTSVASHVFGVPAAQVDHEMRRRAKVINFGIIYGMGVNALRQNLSTAEINITRPEAQKFYDDYFKTFSGLSSYLNEIKIFAMKHGFTETYFGRRRYFEGFKSNVPYVRAAAERMAINAPIQGTEADIIKLAMIRIDNWLKEAGYADRVHLVLQVHDELVYEIKDEVISETVLPIKKIMEEVLPRMDTKGVPIVAEVSAGKSWGSLKPFA